jgi:Protein of unknown function (DUF995)
MKTQRAGAIAFEVAKAMKPGPIIILAAVLAWPIMTAPATATNDGTLPEGAVPLTAAETQALYVGHTAKYDIPNGVARYTWKADGKVLATWEGKNGDVSPAEGAWTVSGNQFCYDADFLSTDTGKSAHHESVCRQWWKVGKARWLKNASGDEYQHQGDIYRSEYANLSKGDQVSAKYAKFKAKLPRN